MKSWRQSARRTFSECDANLPSEFCVNDFRIARPKASGGVRAFQEQGRSFKKLRALISNINAIANGNVDMLLSSAFPLRRDNRTPIGPLPAPDAPVVTQGPTTGTLKASTAAVYGAALYTARLAKAAAPTVYVDTQQQTGIRFMFSDLTPGELYNVDINAIGAAGPSDFSDVGTLRVI